MFQPCTFPIWNVRLNLYSEVILRNVQLNLSIRDENVQNISRNVHLNIPTGNFGVKFVVSSNFPFSTSRR